MENTTKSAMSIMGNNAYRRVVVFGTGKMYQLHKHAFKKENTIVAFVDNDSRKWGSVIDGIVVCPPSELDALEYDFVFILTAYDLEIRRQLIGMKINMFKVYDLRQPEMLLSTEGIKKHSFLSNEVANRKMLLFTHDLTESGACLSLFHAAVILKKLGYGVYVISLNDGDLLNKYISKEIDICINPDILYYRTDWMTLCEEADAVIVNTFCFYYFLQEIEKCYKEKMIWWIHESFIFPSVNKAQFDACIRNLKKVVVVSRVVSDEIREEYQYDCMNIFPCGIPDERRHKNNNESTNCCDRVVFAIIGYINNEIKGHDVFMSAISLLPKNDICHSEFWIVGPGRLKEKEQMIADRYNCIKKVGAVKHSQMSEIYSNVDVVVCASRMESLSLAAVEGMMNEKTVIVSDAAGISEYITDGENGLVFQSENATQLADKMHWVINNAESAREMGKKSRDVYDRVFTLEKYTERLKSLIEWNS